MFFLVCLHLLRQTVHIPLVHLLYFKFNMDDDQDPFGFTVFGTDYVDFPYDWNGNQFKIKNEAEWRESVHKCYTKVPKETLQRFKFVYNMDTEEQQDVKSQAAIHAYHWVLDEFDKDFSQASNRDEVKSMLESQVNFFFLLSPNLSSHHYAL